MIYNVQALRAFAAALVLFVHLEQLLARAGVSSDHLQFGNVGVDLFFVISGFVMVHTVQKRPITGGAFMLNRLGRVAPLYWLMTLVVAATAVAAPRLLHGTEVGWSALVKSLLFIPYVRVDGSARPILFLGWTLNYEMFFYALFALALWWTSGALKRTVALTSVMIVALVVLGWSIGPQAPPLDFYLYPITLEFVLGMAIGLLGPDWRGFGRAGGAACIAVGGAALLLLPFVAGLSPRYILAGLPAALILVGALSLERAGARLTGTTVQLLGGASYALYLTHPFTFGIVAKLWAPTGMLAILYALAAIVVAHLVAIAVHLWIERPLTDRVRHWIGHRPSIVDKTEDRELAGIPAPPER